LKADWIVHILRRNCLLTHIIEGKIDGRIEVTGLQGSGCKQLLDGLRETILETGSTRSRSAENSLWNRLWTYLKKDYRINESEQDTIKVPKKYSFHTKINFYKILYVLTSLFPLLPIFKTVIKQMSARRSNFTKHITHITFNR
jgi:hypothetical protein